MRPVDAVGGGRVVSPVLVGRDDELDRLAATVAAAPSVAVVEGEAGIGKSRLVAELADRPELAGRRFLVGGCGQIREPFPFGPLVEALRERADDLTDVALSPVVGSLRPLLPELASVLPPAPDVVDDQAALRHRQYRGLAELLSALCPAVLVVEDLHWADEQTVEFLTYVLSKPPAGLSLVSTFRAEEAAAEVRSITARPADIVTVDHVVLRPLDMTQTRALAATILDVDDVSESFAQRLCERASGLPLAVQELLALLRSRGEVIRWEGGWARRALDELDVPAGVRDPVQERVERLPPAARAVAQAAAVTGVAVPVEVLTGVAGLADEAGAAEAVDTVLASGLMVETDGTVAFRHVLAAQAVYDAIPFAWRQELHVRAAEAVQSMRRVPLGKVAHHLRQAGRVGEWAEAADRAAAQAMELGDASEAARMLEDVLRHADLAPQRRAELTIRLGWASASALRLPAIGDVLSGPLDSDLPREMRGELRFLLGVHQDGMRVDPAQWYRTFAQAVEDLDDRPDLAAWAMACMGRPIVPSVSAAEHRRWLEQALRLVPDVTDAAVRLYVLALVAMVFVAHGDRRWSDLVAQIERDIGGSVPQRREVNAYRAVGDDACYAGHHEAALRLLTAAMEGASGADLTGLAEFRCRSQLSMIAYCRGAWAGLREKVEAQRRERDSRAHDLATLDAVAAYLSATAGEREVGRSGLREVMRRQYDHGAVDQLPLTVTSLVRLGTVSDDAAAAVAETAQAVALWEEKEVWPVGVRAVPALVEALLAESGGAADRAGGRDAAVELVQRYADRLVDLDAPLAGPALAHARGFLAADQRRWADAADSFTSAADGYRTLPARYEAAQCDEQVAACMLTAEDLTGDGGGRAAAESRLVAAIAAYEEMGARWDLDRATHLARRFRVRLSAPRRRTGDADGVLTERQREVAQLAAAGRTNQEIARELFVSPKTVDKHLSAALHRLGLRSRVELARQLGTTGES